MDDAALIIPGDRNATIRYAANHFLRSYQQAVQRRGSFAVVLAGGATPQTLFATLATAEFRHQIAWQRVHLFWSDERLVPATHCHSNYRLAMDAGLQTLPIPRQQIHPIPTAGDPSHCARHYAALLQQQPLDLIMLGMGSDGHIASLFPFTAALAAQELVVANWVPSKQTWRITLTFAAIERGQEVVLYILGEEKSAALQKVWSSAANWQRWPAQRLKTQARWIVDGAAARKRC